MLLVGETNQRAVVAGGLVAWVGSNGTTVLFTLAFYARFAGIGGYDNVPVALRAVHGLWWRWKNDVGHGPSFRVLLT